MRLDFQAIKRQARATGWKTVLRAVCPDIDPVLDPNDTRNRKRMACPRHGGRHGDGFRMLNDDGGSVCNTCGVNGNGIDTIMFVNGCDALEAFRLVADFLGHGVRVQAREAPLPQPQPRVHVRDDAYIASQLEEVWKGTIDPMDPTAEPMRQYLIQRKLVPMPALPPDIRFHPALKYWDRDPNTDRSRLVGCFPAMVSMVRNHLGQPLTLHRIYLAPDGRKASVSEPKKQMTAPSSKSLDGAAIWLTQPSAILHACEGVENALAIRNIVHGYGHAVCSCLNSYLLGRITPPEGVRLVCLWGDHDRGAGENAVRNGAEHLRQLGLRPLIFMPSFLAKPGVEKFDWNDAVAQFGVDAIRKSDHFQNLLRFIGMQSREMGIARTASA